MIVEDQTRVLGEAIEVAMVALGETIITIPPQQVEWYLMQQQQNQSCHQMQIPAWTNLWKCPHSYAAKNQLNSRNLHIVTYQVRYDLKLLQILW